MDHRLKSLLLLAFCTLAAKTEQNNVPAEHEALVIEKEAKVGDLSPAYRTITLNITVCIPKLGNNDTKFISTSQQILGNALHFTVEAVKPGPKTPCNITACTQDEVPELAVFVFQEAPKKHLICSTNVTNEDLFLTINVSTSEISITPKKTPGTLNSASVSLDVVTGQIDEFNFSQSDSAFSFIIKLEQILIPTTTTVPTTISVPSPTTKKSETTSKETSTTKPPVGHNTTTQQTTQKPVATSSKAPPPVPTIINNGFSLAPGAFWGMVLLVLIQTFLN